MNKQFEQVKQFHTACGIEMPDKPTLLSIGKAEKHFGDDMEELSDWMKNRAAAGRGGEVLNRASYISEELAEFLKAETIEDQVDALIDKMYFILGTFTLMGLNPEPFFNIVAEANLGKIMPDGTFLRDEQGKIKKPEGWQENFAPEQRIREEIERQSNGV